ncbi:helix-turn-helix domain-containing protein [Streptomyces bohaiensis]|uniref:Helix-turn-helix domain-containing protein n=1 Tax=Streptomyces bohaiensis TaxID=1431344 RepID=A0ABX1C8D9_9ACTN|nr:helix-turn-helix domain-containing protein [Streptomyces bohaiensis]NJQ14203.1 helix-turn-helix domain-containing protein [Streptomyces bohaiensis]
MSQSERSQRLLTAAEVAAELRVSTSTVYAWVSSGDIEFVRFGRQRRKGQRGRGGAIRIPSSELTRRTNERP